jgi:Ran GTPase-activating protein (RanGAP) involved in mRNA processing and transport
LEHTGIDAEDVVTLATALPTATRLQLLNLSRNGVGPRGAAALRGPLALLSNLRELHLFSARLGSEGVTEVAGALLHMGGLEVLR